MITVYDAQGNILAHNAPTNLFVGLVEARFHRKENITIEYNQTNIKVSYITDDFGVTAPVFDYDKSNSSTNAFVAWLVNIAYIV